MEKHNLLEHVHAYGRRAKKACQQMLSKTAGERREALLLIAGEIENHCNDIISANKIDLNHAEEKGLSAALIDRLTLNEARIAAMVAGVRQIADQPDPVGSVSELNTQRRGFKVGKMRTPIGVIGIIYESRPNVTLDAASICLKSGNATILRGGSEAFHSNHKIAELIQRALEKSSISKDMVQLIDTTDREAVSIMLESQGLIDVVIPRGGKGLVKLVSDKAKVPVIKHLDGICHVYIDEYADDDKAIAIAFNSKTFRYGVCGAMETLLIHRDKVETVLPKLLKKLAEKSVEVIGDEIICQEFANITPATEADWVTEYLDAKLSIKVVTDINEAIAHINHYGSHHTDAIISEHAAKQTQFLNLVDSASVMVNTATCFADGFEYGLGAEIGISTDKLHVRGPVGVLGLTTEKFIVLGDGEIRT